MRLRRTTRTLTLVLSLSFALVAASCSSGSDRGSPRRAGAAAHAGLHVSGNRLLDASGRRVQLRGVNRSGTEYACIQGWGIFDGPSSAASVRAIAAWHVNAVRIPLNEDCWLGINGVKRQYGGAAYRRAIHRYVQRLHVAGLYAELSLMWAAPAHRRATYQSNAPDADHAPAMWRSLAAAYRNDPDVILAPWGETIVNAGCFLHGGVCEAMFEGEGRYRVAGMQQAVDVMRGAGYRGVIAIPGIDYANDLTKWLSHRPRDPRGQLVAETHAYGGNSCATAACFNRTLAPVARRVPLIFGETGNTYDDSSCGHEHIAPLLDWADAHGAGYLAWTWDTWDTCGSLISSYGGAPRADYGTFIRDRYERRRAGLRLLPKR